MFTEEDLIFSYTTKKAVEDGALVRIDPKVSTEAHIKFPVYFSEAVWKRYVEVPQELKGIQNIQGRLWDILLMFAHKARSTEGSDLQFRFVSQIPNSYSWEPNEDKAGLAFQFREVTLKSVITAQDVDDSSPAIFIMKPWED